MSALYHFSEDPSIRVFEPRVPVHRPEVEPLVWAIDAWHAPMYFFPRDCPRILYWPLPATTTADRERWWGDRDVHMIAVVEWAWFARVQTTTLYRYTLPADGFEELDNAGMFVHRGSVVPLSVEPLPDLVTALRDARVELRIMPDLLPLRGIWASTLHASGIRLRNASGWEGHTSDPPPPQIAAP